MGSPESPDSVGGAENNRSAFRDLARSLLNVNIGEVKEAERAWKQRRQCLSKTASRPSKHEEK